LETPPVLQQTTPGTTYLLKARRLGSVSLGSPIFYRDLTVGEVLGWDIGDMADSVSIHAFVHAPFDHYVREDTRFWNASGVSLKLGADGLQVQVESLLAILLGGIAFDAPVGADGPALKAGEISFPLYDDEAAANAAGFRRRLQLLAYFPGTVDGLAPGAPVKLFGISIGQVTGVGLEYDPKSDAIRVPVHFEVQPERIADVKLAEGRGPLANVRILVQRGMRAQLQSANLLTGQKEVSLTIVQNAPPADVSTEGDVIVVPTSSGGFSELSQSVNDLLARLNKMPFDQIGENLNATLEGLNGIANGPALQKSLASLQSTMKAAQDVLTRLDAGAAPALRRLPGIANDMQAVLARTNALLASAQSGYGDNSRIYRNLDRVLVQLNEMVQSVRVLADLLNRHPEALVRGRTDGGGSP
jgi:paraquat-inducible protein B